jgi:DNA-binding NarL/FixJ family response regulator
MSSNAAVDVLIVDSEGYLADIATGVVHNRFPQSRVVVKASTAEAAACIARDWFGVVACLDEPDAPSLALLQKLGELGLMERTCVVTGNEAWSALLEPLGSGALGHIDPRLAAHEFVSELHRFMAARMLATPRRQQCTPAPRLSAPQTRVLRLLHRGLSSKQIAGELHIAEGTARNHTSALLRTLGAKNRTHAVARGIELGLICSAPPL